MSEQTRPAPTGMDTPPAYVSRINRMYRRDLRPVVLACTFLSFIWAIAVGISLVRNVGDSSLTGKLKTIYLVLGVMYLFTAGAEAYGFAAAWTRRLRLVRLYFYSTALAAIVVTAAEILRVVIHFTDKSSIIQSCVNEQLALNSNPDYVPVTETQARTLCQKNWSNSTWVDIGLLILTGVISFIFASLAAAYYHQLLNPATLRTQTTTAAAPSSAYTVPLSNYPPYPQSTDPYAAGPYYSGGSGAGLPPYVGGGGAGMAPPQYANQGWQGDLAEDKKDPFADPNRSQQQRPYNASGPGGYDGRSEETVTLEPRRDDEHRV